MGEGSRKKDAHIAWRELVAIPEDVGLDHVGAALLRSGNETGPHLRRIDQLGAREKRSEEGKK